MTHVFFWILKSTNWVMVLPSFLISRKQYLDMIFIHVYWVIQLFFLSWLLKPFPENQNTPRKHLRFNHCLSHSRITIEDTFGHWKGPFSRFAKRIDMKVEGVVHLAAASCILHDIWAEERSSTQQMVWTSSRQRLPPAWRQKWLTKKGLMQLVPAGISVQELMVIES